MAGRRGFDPGCRKGGNFLHSIVSSLVLGSTHPPIKSKYRGLFAEGKGAREYD